MGIISKGILGGFSGTVGTVIGGSWKGIDYMRSQPAKRAFNPTPAQQAQQMKFALVMFFLESMVGLVRITFNNYANKMSGYNNAMSYNLKNAVTGTFPTFDIDYSMALVSRGDLPNGGGPTAAPGTTGNINFTWADNSGMGAAQDTDKSILVAYSPNLNLSIYTLEGADRSKGSAILKAGTFSGQTVEVYIGFVSADGNSIATSLYLGQVVVA